MEDEKKVTEEQEPSGVSDEGGSGGVIALVVILILLVIAGVLLYVFRKRLHLAERCAKCRRKNNTQIEPGHDPDDSGLSNFNDN